MADSVNIPDPTQNRPTGMHHVRPKYDSRAIRIFKVRQVLNIIFTLLVIMTIVLCFVKPLPDGLPYFFSCSFAAIAIKMVEVFMRIQTRNRKTNNK